MNKLTFDIQGSRRMLSPAPAARPSLCPLIMVGDPSIEATRSILQTCVELGVGMVELCVPFENAFTDGATLVRAHKRALANGVGLDEALELIAEFKDRLDIVLLADCSYTLRPYGFDRVCQAVRDAGGAGILPHGLPPKLLETFNAAARFVVPTVGTIYCNTPVEIRRRVLAQASAFIYLVSSYGRSGGSVSPGALEPEIAALRAKTDLPIALGFGLKTPSDVSAAFRAGCDIAIVGSAICGTIEAGLQVGDPVENAAVLIAALAAEVPQ